MFKLPNTISCPNCKSEMKLKRDGRGLRTDDILTMRIKTPFYVNSDKITEASLDLSICSQCNTVIGINRKSM